LPQPTELFHIPPKQIWRIGLSFVQTSGAPAGLGRPKFAIYWVDIINSPVQVQVQVQVQALIHQKVKVSWTRKSHFDTSTNSQKAWGVVTIQIENMNTMNFREFASKVRAQAKDAASKMPTFDDMAANDEYIHSEEFNVRGQPKLKLKPKPKPTHDSNSNSNSNSNHSMTAEAGDFAGSADHDEGSSTGSWSLLDRRIASTPQEFELALTTAPPEPQSVKNKSTMPWLSVVANTLENSNDNDNNNNNNNNKPTYSKETSALSGFESDNENGENDTGAYDDSESDADSLDEEDPIMSMIRQDKPTTANKGKEIPKNKNMSAKKPKMVKKSTRLLEDLDQRLLSAENQAEEQQHTINQQRQRQQQQQQQPEHAESNPPLMGSRFGNWARTVMTTQVNRVLRRPESNALPTVLASGISRPPPPLAREKPSTPTLIVPDEENFNVAASSSVLADDDLVQLAKMKQPGALEKLSVFVGSLKENRHFLFILFTLLLAVFSYFYSRRTLVDDVT
jgi:hypothetical protein